MKNWYNNLPEHDQLALKGMIPFVGIYYDLKNAYLYAQEGQYTEALLSALSAIPGIGDYAGLFKVAGIAAKTAKLAKTAKVAATVCRTVGVAGAVASSAANLVVFTNDAINEYQFDGSVSGTTMLSIGASAAGLGLSAKALSKTALWQKVKNGIKKEAEFLWNNNGGYLNLSAFGGKNGRRGKGKIPVWHLWRTVKCQQPVPKIPIQRKIRSAN